MLTLEQFGIYFKSMDQREEDHRGKIEIIFILMGLHIGQQ